MFIPLESARVCPGIICSTLPSRTRFSGFLRVTETIMPVKSAMMALVVARRRTSGRVVAKAVVCIK